MATSATKTIRIKKGEYVAQQEEKPKQNVEHGMDIEEGICCDAATPQTKQQSKKL
jgi:hypothetical protein